MDKISIALLPAHRFADLMVQPRLQATDFEDKSESYLDTFGVTMPAVTTRFGQLKAGPEFSYRLETGAGMVIEPRVGPNLIWNFPAEASAAGIPSLDGDAAGPEGVRGQIELRLRARAPSGFSVEVGGSYDGIGSSDYGAITGRAGVRLPLN